MLYSLFLFIVLSRAQNTPSTNVQVPPLQWLYLSPSLSGSGPTPLRDASLGYDVSTNTLVLFGGESGASVLSGQTYLLDMETLEWSAPVPSNGDATVPPARSLSVGGLDLAANYRHDFIIWGGKGTNGPLDDLWSYNYQNQFWSQATITGSGPSARWGMTGGTNPLQPEQDTLTNTLIVTGGTNGTDAFPFSEVWGLDITGSVASDTSDVVGAWNQYTVSSTSSSGSPKVGQAGVYLGTSVVIAYGGCDFQSDGTYDSACATPDSHFTSVDTTSNTAQWTNASDCPSPRYAAALAPNLNTAAATFASQAFLLFGSPDSSWSDPSNGTSIGEVGILNSDAGTWALVLPSPDPEYGVPSAREGVAVVSISSSVSSRVNASDILVFGGMESSTGKYLSDLWILRAYSGVITETNGTWSGGTGQLQSGIAASGAGVTVQYLTQCSVLLSTATNSTTSTTTPGSSSSSSAPTPTDSNSTPSSQVVFEYDVGTKHKIFSALSIVLLLPAVALLRLSYLPPTLPETPPRRFSPFIFVSFVLGVAAYALGIAGVAIAFASTVSNNSSILKRSTSSTSTLLKTSHGRAGLALFVGLYAVVPFWAAAMWVVQLRRGKANEDGNLDEKTGAESTNGVTNNVKPVVEKTHGRLDSMDGLLGRSAPAEQPNANSASSTDGLEDARAERRKSTRTIDILSRIGPSSWGRQPRVSTDTTPSTSHGFEVVNRPRRVSGRLSSEHPRHDHVNLSDMSWMERRRALTEASDLDYAMSHASHGQSTVHGDHVLPHPLSHPPSTPQQPVPVIPPLPNIILHLVFHAFILFACVLCLVALWLRAPRATFVVFLIWTIFFYISLVVMAWKGRPPSSILSVALSRLVRNQSPVRPPILANETGSSGSPPVILPGTGPLGSPPIGPYTHHQPPYRRVALDEDIMPRSGHPRSIGSDDVDDDDEDDDERQMRMEQEMGRRDVSMIVTVPRRRLVIANE